MSRFCCTYPRRIEVVREHPTLNGIEYLEVVARDAPTQQLQQKTLLVHCVKPLATVPTKKDVTISGGARVQSIEILWVDILANSAALQSAGAITAAEKWYFDTIESPDQVIIIRVKNRGDYSPYTVHLGDPDSPLSGFDVRSASIEFSFKVECPSPFDCKAEAECEQPHQKPPDIDYLSKDYLSFRQLMLDRLARNLPDWQEQNPADIGIAIVEALAAEADSLSVYQDAVATEAYLATARQRTSVRRHARMVDYFMHEGCNARTFMFCEVASGVTNLLLQKRLPDGAPVQFATSLPKNPVVLEPHAANALYAEHKPIIFEPLHALQLHDSHNSISLHSWSDEACHLPCGATSTTLKDNAANRLLLRAGDYLLFEEVRSPHTGQTADANPAKRHVVRLTSVYPEAELDALGNRQAGALQTDELLDQPIVQISWDKADALPFSLCISAEIKQNGVTAYYEDLSIARANIVLSDHGQTLDNTEIVETNDLSNPFRPFLREKNITRSASLTLDQAASLTRVQNPAACNGAAWATDNAGYTWTAAQELLSSDRFDTHFVIERHNGGKEQLRFGDDLYGRNPASVASNGHIELTLSYRIGNGSAGNCGADSLKHIVHTPGAGIVAVRNPLAAIGGIEPEALEAVRVAAPVAFQRQHRAVTAQDYSDTAMLHPAVSRAYAVRRYTGSWHTMFLSIDRYEGKPVDAAFEADLVAFLESYRLCCHDLEITPPHMLSVDIALTICVLPEYIRADVAARLLEAFSTRQISYAQRGFFHPDNFTFGQPLYLSAIIDTAQQVEGVRFVSVDPNLTPAGYFHPYGTIQRDEIQEGIIATGPSQIIRCDNDPNNPENGRIRFFMMGGM